MTVASPALVAIRDVVVEIAVVEPERLEQLGRRIDPRVAKKSLISFRNPPIEITLLPFLPK